MAKDIAIETLPVMEAFYTLQGEGFHQGKAAYFIRLGGCNVECFWCDVKESWDASIHPQKTINEIINEAKKAMSLEKSLVNGHQSLLNGEKPLSGSRLMTDNAGFTIDDSPLTIPHFQEPSFVSHLLNNICVITGGEPLMHNLHELTLQLRSAGFKTHIETSGSSPLSGYWDWICLSPKKFKQPLPEVFTAAHELKVIVYNKSDFKWAEENAAQVAENCKLYLQPEWSKAAQITPLIINYIKANPQWQLSLQVHKYLNIP